MKGDDLLYYFGCWGGAGHHLWNAYKQQVGSHAKRLKLPEEHDLDGGPLYLPPEKVGDGAITHLPAPQLTVVAWWGNPWDLRGKVKNALVCRGMRTEGYVREAFRILYPELHEKLPWPTIVTRLESIP